jgi:hypothetical protein
MGSNPNSADNRWLRGAMEQQTLLIYFLGTSPGQYQPIIPTFIVGWYPEQLCVLLAFGAIVGASAQTTAPAGPERRYALREVRARLHQASFRGAVLGDSLGARGYEVKAGAGPSRSSANFCRGYGRRADIVADPERDRDRVRHCERLDLNRQSYIVDRSFEQVERRICHSAQGTGRERHGMRSDSEDERFGGRVEPACERVFGFTKVRYRGLNKNAHRLVVTCALANLFMVRRQLLRFPAT